MIYSLYYIRFLKPPPSICELYQPFNIVWTIENDLGDQPFELPVTLTCDTSLPDIMIKLLPLDKKKKSELAFSTLEYQPYYGGGMVTRMTLVPRTVYSNKSTRPISNNIQLTFSLAPEYRGTNSTEHPVWPGAYSLVNDTFTWIIPTWSMPICVKPRKNTTLPYSKDPAGAQQAQRWVTGTNHQMLRICEDVEQSIARHVWDCGLAMCDFIMRHKDQIECDHVIELGSGTGLVGLLAAQALQPKTMSLTDLPDALQLMQQNIDTQKASSKTLIEAKILSWGPKSSLDGNDKDVNANLVWCGDEKTVDLILLTDVLYNQGSHDLLLQTLEWLLINPRCRVLLGYKERNSDERAFFTKVSHRHWQCIRATNSSTISSTSLSEATINVSSGDNDDEYAPFEIYWIQK